MLDRSGQRIALLVTDGIGDVWQSDVQFFTLATWCATMPVSVVHPLLL